MNNLKAMKYKAYILKLIIVFFIFPLSNSYADNNSISEAVRYAYKDYYSGNVTNSINSLNSFLSNIPQKELIYSQDLWIAYSSLIEICETVGDVNCVIDGTNRLISIYKSLKPNEQADKSYLNEEINYHVFSNQLLVDNIDILDNILKSNYLDMHSNPYSPNWYIKNQLLSAKINLRFGGYKKARLATDRAFAMILSFKPSTFYRSFIAKSLLEVIGMYFSIGDTTRAVKLLLTSNAFLGNSLSENEPHAIAYILLIAQHNEYLAHFQLAYLNYQWVLDKLNSISLPIHIKNAIYAHISPRLSIACVLLDNIVCANNAIKVHPQYANIDNIISYKKLKSRQELLFFASYMLTQSVINTNDIPDNVIQLFTQPLEIIESNNRINLSNKAIQYWALGVAGRNKDRQTSTKNFAISAKYNLEIYENEYLKTDSAFLLLDAYQKIMLGSGATAIADRDYNDDNKYEILLNIIESFNRGLRNADSDAYIRQAGADNEDLKQIFSSLYLLNMKKVEIEVKRLAKLIDNINNIHNGITITDNIVINYETFQYLEDLEVQKQKLINNISNNSRPDLDIYKLTNIKELQSVMNTDELFITNMLFLGHIIHLGVTKDSVSSYSIPVDYELLNNDIKILNMSLRLAHAPSIDSDSQYPVESALRLYNNLLKPFEQLLVGKKHIIWSPDQNIYDLAIDCLLKSIPPKLNVGYDLSKAEWTIRDYALSYVSSAKGFIASRKLHNNKYAKYDFLGIGDPALSGITNEGTSRGQSIIRRNNELKARGINELPNLPETAEELKTISKLFDGQKDLLLKENATEKIFRQQSLSNYRFIEFATHGLIKNEIIGLAESALVLTPQTENDESNDGLLTASEIARLNLNAELVVLSSCNSANYELDKFGLEVQGLTTAFALAGVPTTIASLWPVESITTQIINTSLFKELKLNKYDGPAIAHHNAINAFLKSDISPEYYHPRFWAPFVVYGDGGNTKNDRMLSNNKDLIFDNMYISKDNMYGTRIYSSASKSILNDGLYILGFSDFEDKRVKGSLLKMSNEGNTEWIIKENNLLNSILLYNKNNETNYLVGNELVEKDRTQPIILRINERGKKEWRKIYPIDNNYAYWIAIGAIILDDNSILIAYWAWNQKNETSSNNKNILYLLNINMNGEEIKRRKFEFELENTNEYSMAFNKNIGRIIITANSLDIKEVKPTISLYLNYKYLEVTHQTEIIILDAIDINILQRNILNSVQIRGTYSDNNDGFYGVGERPEFFPYQSLNMVVYNISANGEAKLLFEEKGPYNYYGNGLVEIDNNKLAIFGQIRKVWDIESPEEKIPWDKKLDIIFDNPENTKEDRNTSSNGIVIVITKDGKVLEREIFSTGSSVVFENGVYMNRNLWLIGTNNNEMVTVKYKYIGE